MARAEPAARQRQARPPQAAPKPYAAGLTVTLQPPARGPAAPRVRQLPNGLRAPRPAAAPVPVGTPGQAPGSAGANSPAPGLPEVLRPAVTATCWVDPGKAAARSIRRSGSAGGSSASPARCLPRTVSSRRRRCDWFRAAGRSRSPPGRRACALDSGSSGRGWRSGTAGRGCLTPAPCRPGRASGH